MTEDLQADNIRRESTDKKGTKKSQKPIVQFKEFDPEESVTDSSLDKVEAIEENGENFKIRAEEETAM